MSLMSFMIFFPIFYNVSLLEWSLSLFYCYYYNFFFTSQIRTFDGLVHEFEPSSCWATATIHIAEREAFEFEKYQELSVQARYNDEGWEVRLIWPFSALMLDITRSEILVCCQMFCVSFGSTCNWPHKWALFNSNVTNSDKQTFAINLFLSLSCLLCWEREKNVSIFT